MTFHIQRRLRRASRATALLGALVLAATSLAACGSGSGGSGGSSDDIRVGVIGTYTGPLSSDSAVAKDVAEAWADSVNAKGGLKGHKIKLYIEDDQGNPARALTALKRLVVQKKVVAIVGSAAQGTDAAWGKYLDTKKVPHIGGLGASTGSFTSKSYFDTSANIIALFYGTAATAADVGPKLAQLYCAGSAPCASTVDLLKGMGKPLGLSLPFSSAVDGAAPDYSAICEGVKSSGANAFSTSLTTDVMKRVAAQCEQQGVSATLISQVSTAGLAGQPGFDNVTFVDSRFPFFVDSTPATKAFHDALKKYAPDLGSEKKPLNFMTSAVWISGKLFEAAVNAINGDEITSTTIENGLYSLKDETLGGLSAPLNFSPDKKILNNCYFSYTLKDGVFADPNGLTPKCAPSEVVDAIAKAM